MEFFVLLDADVGEQEQTVARYTACLNPSHLRTASIVTPARTGILRRLTQRVDRYHQALGKSG
jgi:hypothetical protein